MAIKSDVGTSGSGKTGRRPGVRYVVCGTPEPRCVGILKPEVHMHVHGDQSAALRCTTRYMKGQGYKRLGRREFALSDTSPIIVLPKRFLVARPGKYDGILRAICEKMPMPAAV